MRGLIVAIMGINNDERQALDAIAVVSVRNCLYVELSKAM